jgi:histidinol dehydrogenase
VSQERATAEDAAPTGDRRDGTARLRRVRLADWESTDRAAAIGRTATAPVEVRDRARAIVEAVRDGGDAALREANLRFGGGLATEDGAPAALRIEPAALSAAGDGLPSDLRAALLHRARNIETFHASQVPPAEQWAEVAPGVRVGRAWRALDRVAAYVPGGEAAYPSSLLMSAIPARLAGVPELVVASPAGRDGRVSSALLGAAGLMGVTEFYVMGGAQAIAALAYGTPSVRPVDRIVGPGTHGSRPPSSRCSRDLDRYAGARPRSWSWPTRAPTRRMSPRTS